MLKNVRVEIIYMHMNIRIRMRSIRDSKPFLRSINTSRLLLNWVILYAAQTQTYHTEYTDLLLSINASSMTDEPTINGNFDTNSVRSPTSDADANTGGRGGAAGACSRRFFREEIDEEDEDEWSSRERFEPMPDGLCTHTAKGGINPDF